MYLLRNSFICEKLSNIFDGDDFLKDIEEMYQHYEMTYEIDQKDFILEDDHIVTIKFIFWMISEDKLSEILQYLRVNNKDCLFNLIKEFTIYQTSIDNYQHVNFHDPFDGVKLYFSSICVLLEIGVMNISRNEYEIIENMILDNIVDKFTLCNIMIDECMICLHKRNFLATFLQRYCSSVKTTVIANNNLSRICNILTDKNINLCYIEIGKPSTIDNIRGSILSDISNVEILDTHSLYWNIKKFS